MPVGVSWSQYIKFCVSAYASMFAGGACVHWIYKPDLVSFARKVTVFFVLF